MTRTNHAGFTLIDVLVAIMIIAILATVSVPNLNGLLQGYRLNGAARLVWLDVQRARMAAIKESRTIRVEFTPTAYTAVRVGTGEVVFRRELAGEYARITVAVTGDSVAFDSAGMGPSPTRTVQIQGTSGQKRFTIQASGRVGTIS